MHGRDAGNFGAGENRSREKLRRDGLTIASETFQHTGSFKFRAAYNLTLIDLYD